MGREPSLHFRWGHEFRETEPYSSGGKKVARYYLAETTQSQVAFSINPAIGMPEHHEYRWLVYEDLCRLAPKRLLPIVEWAGKIVEE